MAVRNLRNVGGSSNVKPIPIHVWIPPVFNVIHKIEVDDGTTTYDVTDLVIEANFTMSTTENIGSFNVTVDNSAEVYTNIFKGWNKIYLYMDYGNEATSKIFTGMIDKPSKTNNNIVLIGQSSASRFTKKFITYTSTDKSKSDILKEIIEENFTDLSISGIEENSALATVNYTEVYFQDVIIDLCGDDYDGYVDENFVMQYFEKGSRLNETEAVVHDMNLINTGDFSQDLQQLSNKIRVYGKSKDSIPLVYTSEDTDSISKYDQRDAKIEITSLSTQEEIKRVAEYQKKILSGEITTGTVTSLALPTLKPGEKLRVSDPQNGLEPGEYLVKTLNHLFSNDDPQMTEVTLEKETTSMSRYLGGRIKYESEVSNRENPYGLDYSYIIDYLTVHGTFNNTSRLNVGAGMDRNVFLRLSSGSTGNWISGPIQLEKAPTERVEFRMIGEKLENAFIEYSFNGGASYKLWGAKESYVNASDEITLRVTITDLDTRVKYIGIMYT